MSVTPFFKAVPTMTVEEVREYLDQHQPDQFTLLDVRQPEEYTESHLPGALLIPVDELHNRMGEIDRDRPVIVYCRSGMRAGNGTSTLLSAGFREVWNMEGGILTWQGAVATGAPAAGMSWFEEARAPEDYVALAWILEAGAGVFYSGMAQRFASSDVGDLFRELAAAEHQHKASLEDAHRTITGKEGAPAPPAEVEARDTMEGGISLSEALTWAAQQQAADVLEFAVAMELNAYDRYLKVARSVGEGETREVLERLAREEKSHLARLLKAFLRHVKKESVS